MKKLIFFIFIFLLNYGVVLNVETCQGMSLQHIYKNLAAQSMFQLRSIPGFLEMKIKKIEKDISLAKSITDQFEKEKALFGVLLKVNEFDSEKLDLIFKKRFFCLKINLLIDLGLYMTADSFLEDIEDEVDLKDEFFLIYIFQKKQELSDNLKKYIDGVHSRFDQFSLMMERPDFNIDLKIFIHQCFVEEWEGLTGNLEFEKRKFAKVCEFYENKERIYLIRDCFVKKDFELLLNILETILKSDKIPFFTKKILGVLPSKIKEGSLDFKEMHIGVFEVFFSSLEEIEEGIKYLEALFGCLPAEDLFKKDFFDFTNRLRKDWQDAFPYIHAYGNILYFLKQNPYSNSPLILFSSDQLEQDLYEVIDEQEVTDRKDKIFLFSLLTAIKSKDVAKYKIALENLKILTGQEQPVNYSDMYVNLFVATWNTYKEQPGFVINPIATEIDIACEGLIRNFYEQDMQKIAWVWKCFDKAKFQSSILVENFLPSEGREVTVIGDIHGEVNGIIFPLVSKDLIRLTGNVILWDMKTRQRVYEMSTTVVFLPEIEILPEKKEEILQFLGDFVDKGKFTDECIAFLDYLFKESFGLLRNNLHLVLGNHEFNLLKNGLDIIPTYNGRNFLLVKEIIRSWISDDILQYSYVENGWLYTHSFISINFLKALYDELDQYKTVINPALMEQAKIAINWFLNNKAEEELPEQIDVVFYQRPDLDFNSEEYKNNIRVLNEILNQLFRSQINRTIDPSVPTEFTSCIFNSENSPILIRQTPCVFVPCTNIKNGFGHIPLPDNDFFVVYSHRRGAFYSKQLVDYDYVLSYGMRLLFNANREVRSHCKYNLGRNCTYLNFDPVYFRSGFMKDFEINTFADPSVLKDLEEIQLAQEEFSRRA